MNSGSFNYGEIPFFLCIRIHPSAFVLVYAGTLPLIIFLACLKIFIVVFCAHQTSADKDPAYAGRKMIGSPFNKICSPPALRACVFRNGFPYALRYCHASL